MIRMAVGGIGIRAPGIDHWESILQNPEYTIPIEPAPEQPKGIGQGLPGTERRRATAVTRLALDLAMEAAGNMDTRRLSAVFCSSGGEVTVVHQIFSMLAEGDNALSPTAFHNSVHNAAQGYWSIASGSTQPADSICAFDDSFGAGLAECCLRYADDQRNLLLVTYDIPPPFPISSHRRIHNAMGGALLLAADNVMPKAFITVRYEAGIGSEQSTSKDIQDSTEHPGSGLIRLIMAIARKQTTEVAVRAGFGGTLHVLVEPC